MSHLLWLEFTPLWQPVLFILSELYGSVREGITIFDWHIIYMFGNLTIWCELI